MASSSRIIGAADVTEIREFKLDELRQGKGASGHAGRHAGREDEGPPPGWKHGYQRGLEEGMRRGAEAARQQFNQDQGNRLQAIAEEFARRTGELHDGMSAALAVVRDDIAGQTIDLALEVARQVIGSQLKLDPGHIESVVREAIASLIDERAAFSLHVNPDDADLLGSTLEPVLASRAARLVSDPAIQAGGCRITSASAEIDATLGTRWQRVLASIGRPESSFDKPGTP